MCHTLIKKERDSNIELLRLIAMFLVLIVHADFFSLGAPKQTETILAPLGAFSRFFFESLSIICVNVFVLISGWFGIRPSAKSFCNFVFQCLFFLVGIYALMLSCGLSSLSVRGIAGCFVMLKWNWFIKAYIGLYILSPILNAFVSNADKKTYKAVLLAFFAFQTLYAWVSNGAVFFEDGYSTMSFIGSYLLARYVRIYFSDKKILPPPYVFLCTFGSITLIITIVSFFSVRLGLSAISGRMYSYVNPLVIISAMSLLLYFSSLRLKNKMINWCAASSFAIFLLHTNPNLCEPYFKPFVLWIYNTYNGIMCLLLIALFLLVVAIAAILIDQIRKLIWKRIAKSYF